MNRERCSEKSIVLNKGYFPKEARKLQDMTLARSWKLNKFKFLQ